MGFRSQCCNTQGNTAAVRTWFLSWSLLLLKRGVHAGIPSTSVSASSTASCSGPSSSSSSFHSNVSSSPAGADTSIRTPAAAAGAACLWIMLHSNLQAKINIEAGSKQQRCHRSTQTCPPHLQGHMQQHQQHDDWRVMLCSSLQPTPWQRRAGPMQQHYCGQCIQRCHACRG